MDTPHNAILALLDSIGLPWRSSEADLIARYGTRSDGPYQHEVVSIPTRPPLLSGLLRPIEVQIMPQFASDLPMLEFRGQASQGRDAGFNIRFAAAELRPMLGDAELRKRGNVLRCDWRWGRASIGLTAWPPELQGIVCNTAHERDPRLVTACHVTVTTGFRPAATPSEMAWITSYEALAPIRATNPELMRSYALEFLRDVDCPQNMRRTVGWSRDRQALIFCDDELHIVRVDDIVWFGVRRFLPAKGAASSDLTVSCRTRLAGWPVKELHITSASGPDDLNELGARLAEALEKPCEIAPYEYNV